MSIGTIFAYASSNPPAGALVLDGQTVLSSDYPDLYNWVKTNADNKTIRTITSAAYINEIEEYGFCGAFVISENNVKLPNYQNAFIMGSDSSNIGYVVPAGLPNITGLIDGVGRDNGTTVSGAFYTRNSTRGACYSTDYNYYGLTIDASLSNPIYGKSDTVQPPAIKTIWCIQAKKTNNYLGSTGCDCPDKNTIQGWIDDKIKNINTGTGLSIGTIFSHVSKNPPARCILT
jgi:hypothetical protein